MHTVDLESTASPFMLLVEGELVPFELKLIGENVVNKDE